MMAQMMKQMGQASEAKEPAPILQINPKHELLEKLKDSSDVNLVEDAAHVLLDQAKLFDGQELDDTADFILRLNRIMAKAGQFLYVAQVFFALMWLYDFFCVVFCVF